MQKKKVKNEINIKTAVMFIYDFVKRSKKTNVFSKIIITKAKLQALQNSEI